MKTDESKAVGNVAEFRSRVGGGGAFSAKLEREGESVTLWLGAGDALAVKVLTGRSLADWRKFLLEAGRLVKREPRPFSDELTMFGEVSVEKSQIGDIQKRFVDGLCICAGVGAVASQSISKEDALLMARSILAHYGEGA